MDINKLISFLPDSVKQDIVDFSDVKLSTGKISTRVTIDRLLSVEEKSMMNNKHFIGIDCVAVHRYAPEIKRSYFYVV